VSRCLDAARLVPDHPAVLGSDAAWTYREFARKILKFANLFLKVAARPRIAICAHKNADTYAAMFAAMAAGGFYVPINPEAGTVRVQTVFREIEPHAVFADAANASRIAAQDPAMRILLAEDAADEEFSVPETNPHRLAYVMYTSGSTGSPKGVMIPQSALDHYTGWAIDAMNMTPRDRMSQHPNIGFDLSVLDIYASFCSGATLVPLDDKLDRLFPGRAIARHKLTVWNSVPSVMGLMLKSGDWTAENTASLRLLTFCGEPLLPQHLDGIFAVRPDVMVHNTYGPTEATVSCTLLRLNGSNYRNHCEKTVALGNPIEGTEFLIDGGNEGELMIGGKQLASGYWGDDGRTATAFREIEHNGKRVRFYHTGDYVVRKPRGLFFLERRDHQVKIKGHRIELDEISARVREASGVHAETIVYEQQIVSFVEAQLSQHEIAGVQKKLGAVLDSYMMPNFFVPLAQFPRNANDKVSLEELKMVWQKMKEASSRVGS
jgi:D-alanine--poly(phosphoribitol) ligase subunit 1